MAKYSLVDELLKSLSELISPEHEKSEKEKDYSEYYKNPFGGFLP